MRRRLPILLFPVLLVAATGCDRPAHPQKFTKGIEGVWVIDTESSLRAITEIPSGLQGERVFRSIGEYRAWVRPRIEGARFEIHPNGKAFLRHKDGTLTKMAWEKRDGNYWVGQRGGYYAASVGHVFELKSDRQGICRYQMDYSESVAPRSPLIVRKVWE